MNDHTPVPSALRPERQPLLAYLGCSVLLHLSAVGAALGSAWGAGAFGATLALLMPMCAKNEPLKPDIEVSLVALPKSDHKMPDRAARAPVTTGETPPVPVPEPPPVKQSDLKFETEKPEPKPGIDEEEVKRQELMDKIERQRLLQALEDAPEGPVDRMPTDPNGSEDLELAVLGAASRGDPELARWVAKVQGILQQHFRPLTQGKDLVCYVRVGLDPETGQITGSDVVTSSGVIAFDQAALRAVQEMGSVPPPPEKFRPLIAADKGVKVRFVPPS
ncbi:MAG: cell envelope integrity protein TolA [Myxococcota bacterium]